MLDFPRNTPENDINLCYSFLGLMLMTSIQDTSEIIQNSLTDAFDHRLTCFKQELHSNRLVRECKTCLKMTKPCATGPIKWFKYQNFSLACRSFINTLWFYKPRSTECNQMWQWFCLSITIHIFAGKFKSELQTNI